MLRRYRHIGLAFITATLGLLLITDASAAVHPQNKPHPHQEASSETSPVKELVKSSASSESYSAYSDSSANECYYANNHDSADLCAQWRAALAAEKASESARWANLIGGISAFLTFVSIILVLCALRQGRDAHKLSEETAKRQLRAYLSIKEVYIKRKSPNVLRAVIQNSGQTPATSVHIETETLRPGEGIKTPVDFGIVGPGAERPHIFGLAVPISPHDTWVCRQFVRFTYSYTDAFGDTWENTVFYFLNLSEKRDGETILLYPCPTKDGEVKVEKK